MYLHINQNCVIKNSSIIGIFSIKNEENKEKLLENLDVKIIDLSEGNPKTFILVKDKDEVKGYILKLNLSTIKTRFI